MSVILFTHPAFEHITDKRRKYKWCDDLRSFVSRIKPYGEPDSAVMPWNDTEHDRKFIECKCDVLNADSTIQTVDNQRFWGEWEQPSRIFRIDKGDEKELKANYVHIPLYGRLDDALGNEKYRGYQNTDPYVFGDSFFYCCCKQGSKERNNLISLNEDDIIIFCGLFGKGNEYRYSVDTIFVVKESVCKYGPRSTDFNNEECFVDIDSNYINGVLNPVLYGNDESLGGTRDKYYVLYRAKMFSDNPKGIFSYFPVKYESNYKRVEIPYSSMQEILNTTESNAKILNRSQATLHDLDSYEVWNKLKDYIVGENKYSMGIKAYDEFDDYYIETKLQPDN